MLLTVTQIAHILRNFKQKVFLPEVAIIGGYHGGNLGDMALGMSVSDVLKSEGIPHGLQTIYNLERWPKTQYGIVGGGAVGYGDSLQKLSLRYKGNLDNISLLGVDFNDQFYSKDCIQLMKSAAYVSGRSKEQADRLKSITGREDIHYHPDIAFSLFQDFCQKERAKSTNNKPGKLLINVISLYGKLVNGKVVASEKFRAERPELYYSHSKMFAGYKSLVRKIAKKAIREGFEVETIPFTNEDVVFGRIILEDLPIKHNNYQRDPFKMIKHMSTATTIFATRYHATIFALKLGIPLYGVAYATKNELLFRDLNIERPNFITSIDLAKGIEPLLEPIFAEAGLISNYEMASRAAIVASYNALKYSIF